MTRLGISKFRKTLADTVSRVADKKERVVLHRHGKDVAAIVPIEDLRILKQLDDIADLKAARKALKELGSIPYEKARKEMELTPTVRKLLGALRGSKIGRAKYRKHLEKKYS